MTNREKALVAQREYMREWRRRNPNKVREHNRRYWVRRAEKMQQQAGRDTEKGGGTNG